ncbi:MAG: hypothetical protein QM813_00780 [Verrucomicrobiota bacterium]
MKKSVSLTPWLMIFAIIAGCAVGQRVQVNETQKEKAETRIERLFARWRWWRHWYGETELGGAYYAGRRIEFVFFWPSGEAPDEIGFCANELSLCQHYRSIVHYLGNDARPMAAGEDVKAAAQHFVEWLPKKEYTFHHVFLELPPLSPPRSIVARKSPPPDELKELASRFQCRPDQANCSVEVMVPFYDDEDPRVLVYWNMKCATCADWKPSIIAMTRIDKRWAYRISDVVNDPKIVARVRDRILAATALVIRFPAASSHEKVVAGRADGPVPGEHPELLRPPRDGRARRTDEGGVRPQ